MVCLGYERNVSFLFLFERCSLVIYSSVLFEAYEMLHTVSRVGPERTHLQDTCVFQGPSGEQKG